MKKKAVNIDFKALAKQFRLYVRQKAALAGNTIVYIRQGEIIEEDPQTRQVRVLKREYIA